MDARQFLCRLESLSSDDTRKKYMRYFKLGSRQYGEGDQFIGVRTGEIVKLAREFIDMPLSEIGKLLESPIHEARMGAVSVMDWQARHKNTSEYERRKLFKLYLKRHDRINNWDLVDRSAPQVVGGYIFDKPHDILYRLARSKSLWERRTAIVSTSYFIRQGETEDTFHIAEILLNDDQDLIHKATGWLLREAGKKDRKKLLGFLDKHAATMPRTTLRYSLKHLDPEQKKHYMNKAKSLQ